MTRAQMRKKLIDRYSKNSKIVKEIDNLFKNIPDCPENNYVLQMVVKVYLR